MGALAIAAGLALLVLALVATDDGGSSDPVATTTSAARDGDPATTTTAAGAGEVAAATTAPTTPAGLGVGVADERGGRRTLRGFAEVAVTITAGDGRVCEVCLLAATDEAQRARGLMEVTDPELGGYDGMLFVYEQEVSGGFWMRNTPMPLSIGWFDAAGDVVSTVDMEPCQDSPTCPNYPAAAPFRFAVEVPQGRLAEVGIEGEATLRVDGYTCPAA